jgi:DNA-binding NtrC family response regulator
VTGLFATRNRAAAELAGALGRLAATDLPLLLEGETGTGKSYLADRIHRRGRAPRPFVVLDCGVLPGGLLPSELFGHRAGAFTDATRSRVGWLERAGDGTLVLDRIEALAPEAQVALLRVLEERRFSPVGGGAARQFRARVVALAGAGVAERLASGALRRDLYHRLAGLHAELPPLRRRPEDILPFARATVRRAARQLGRPLALDAEAEALLEAQPWPGNFRELATLIERCCLLAPSGTVGVAVLGLDAGNWSTVAAVAAERALPLERVTRLYALAVLAGERGNVSRAARLLGVSRRTLIRWRQES